MRSDVKPHQQPLGRWRKRVGEDIRWPEQQVCGRSNSRPARRLVADFVQSMSATRSLPAIDNVTSAMLEKRSADLERFTGMKTAVVEKLEGKGAVPVPKATAEIDKQIANLKAQRLGN